MYLILLIFGGLLAAAGAFLVVSGSGLHGGVFDPTIVTPGAVAVIGGIVLFALGLALRVLRRIERSLAARPMPRPAQPGEPAVAPAAELAAEPPRLTLPARAAPRLQVPPAAATAPAGAAEQREEEKHQHELPFKLPERSPAVARPDATRIAAEAEPLTPHAVVPKFLAPAASARSTEEAEVADVRALRRVGGAATARIAPRLDLNARSPLATERAKGPALDSLWPKGQRPTLRAVTPVPAAPAVPAEQKPEPERAPNAVAPSGTAEPVTVLKSGVVDGMSYTLYSDGSIEAALPQGTLRFGSITELRNHIERSA